jgi:tripartite-type tricarboxylate transporter receptor subunit TctC
MFRRIVTLGAVSMTASLAPLALAQDYPTRPVRVVVPFAPGGPAELIARLVGQKLAESFGQQFIIDTRGGGGGTIGADIVAKAAPDGHTLLLHTVGHVIAPSLYRKLPYDAESDLLPIALANNTQLLMIVHTSVPAKSVQDLIALARAKPRQLTYASSGNGGISHLAVHLFLTMTGAEMTHVPYKGMGPGLADVVAGQVNMVTPDPTVALPHVRSGRVVPLGLTGAKRIPVAPQIPTIAESGVPGYEVGVWYGFFAPRGTHRAVIEKMHAGVVKAMASPEIRDRYVNEGADVAVRGPAEFASFLRSEFAKWSKVVKDSGVKID